MTILKHTIVLILISCIFVNNSNCSTEGHAEEIICRCKKRYPDQCMLQLWCTHEEIGSFNRVLKYGRRRDLQSLEMDIFLNALRKWCDNIDYECSYFEYTGRYCNWGKVLEEIQKKVEYYRTFGLDVDNP